MDLGISGRTAIVCASSRGLGKACAQSLAREGVRVVLNGRDAEALAKAAEEIRTTTGGEVTTIAGDIGDAGTRERLLEACPMPDILINNNGGPLPGRFQDWGEDQWGAAVAANMFAPLAMIRAVCDGMIERRFGRIVNITSAMVKAPHAAMGLSTGARAGLTAVCKGLSREFAPFNVTINNLLPERIDTDRQRFMAMASAAMKGISVDQAYAEMRESIAAKRLGTPAEFGDTCAFVCSAQAGFLTGQNIQLDGGTFAGVF